MGVGVVSAFFPTLFGSLDRSSMQSAYPQQ